MYYGVDKYDLGTGFGHFAIATPDVYKLVEDIKAKGGIITREPGPVKGGKTVIAFAKDPDGYLFELIQRGPTPEPLCQVMLRVGDLDRSIKFYEKLVELLDSPLYNYFTQNDCLNYFFYFQWVLIQIKREFEFETRMRLWEVLWTHYLSEHLHLYICVAILKLHRNKKMGEQMDFDNLLKFINELSGHIDLDLILRDAEALCICAGENGAACIPPGTPPSLPREENLLYPQEDYVL